MKVIYPALFFKEKENTKAEELKINFSKTLEEALIEKIYKE